MKKLKVADCRKNIIRRYFHGQSLKEIAKDYRNPTIGVISENAENSRFGVISEKEIRRDYQNPNFGKFPEDTSTLVAVKNPEPETRQIKGFGYSAITEDRRKNKELWDAEIARLRAIEIDKIHEHHQLLLKATLKTDKLFERTGLEKDKQLHQQNLRELAHVSRQLAEVLEDFPAGKNL